ncbi:MAG: ATP-binding protein [Bdellovibrionota bacterium]
MIKRDISKVIKETFKHYPVITVTGPRQSGKTTLIQMTFKNKPYFNLEDPRLREFAINDPTAFLDQMPNGGIIDEIQHVPQLFSYIQVLVDARKKNGLFILSGSQQFSLQKSISQSLAGRTAIFHLLPLSISELKKAKKLRQKKFEPFLLDGFFPKIHSGKKQNLNIFYGSYFETYVEKDIRTLINIKDLSLFKKFVTLCAGRIGQLLNKESLARDVGISQKTVEEWLSILEASFILFRLQPYYVNVSKRLIKTPKLYFYEPGLASYLLNISNEEQLSSHPLKGNLFENLIVVEAMKHKFNFALRQNISFYRDSNNNEIDLLIETGNSLLPLEIKSSQTFHMEFVKTIENLSQPLNLVKGAVVYGGDVRQNRTNFTLLPWFSIDDFLKSN